MSLFYDALTKKPEVTSPVKIKQEPDPKPYENIKTFEDAFEIAKGHFKMRTMPDFSSILPEGIAAGITAFTKLQIIAWAINNDNPKVVEWIPDYKNINQNKWAVVYHLVNREFYPVRGGGRLVFKDERRSAHAEKYFRSLYKDLYLIDSQTVKNGELRS